MDQDHYNNSDINQNQQIGAKNGLYNQILEVDEYSSSNQDNIHSQININQQRNTDFQEIYHNSQNDDQNNSDDQIDTSSGNLSNMKLRGGTYNQQLQGNNLMSDEDIVHQNNSNKIESQSIQGSELEFIGSQKEINNFLNDQLGEQFRLSSSSLRQMEQDNQNKKDNNTSNQRLTQQNYPQNSLETNNYQKLSSSQKRVLENKGNLENQQEQLNTFSPQKQQENLMQQQISQNNQQKQNIFGKTRSGSKTRDSVKSLELNQEVKKAKGEKLEREFENKCLRLLKIGDWNSLDQVSSTHLEDTQGTSFKGFFYLGVSFYKVGDYENSIRAFQKAEEINSDDAQLHYNLGLAFFKQEQYNQAVDHLKKCTKLDEQHIHAYNNLAYLFNMHQFYSETIQVCGQAKMNNPANHNCHRHWSFALFKKGEFAKAIKKIKKGVQKCPTDPENWIIWGLILRTVGNYVSARHKFKKALKIDKDNETAKEELSIVERIIVLDQQIPLESVPSLRRGGNQQQLKKGISKDGSIKDMGLGADGCARSCQNNSCRIF